MTDVETNAFPEFITPDEQLAEFMRSGRPIEPEIANMLREMDLHEGREELQGFLEAVIATTLEQEEIPSDGMQNRAKYVRAIGGKASNAYLKQITQSTRRSQREQPTEEE